MSMVQYIVISSVAISIFYIAYTLIFRNESNFRQLRAYLLISIFISMLIPFNPFKIKWEFPLGRNAVETTSSALLNAVNPDPSASLPNNKTFSDLPVQKEGTQAARKGFEILKMIYLGITFLLLARFIFQIITIIQKYFASDRIKQGHMVFIRNNRIKSTFSFFHWIFLPEDFSSGEDTNEIILHEKVHASQYHTFDLILIELLAAVMWFNPLIWMMRNSIQLVHEYLADEGALSTGIDKLKYQALLINQVSEARLICLSSNFNHSLIKKRMIMMTKSKFNQQTKLKILALVPVTMMLFIGIACVNSQNKARVVTAVEPVRMNILYVGADNPIKIAASGYETSELSVSIDNGTISGKDGEYLVRPKQPGSAILVVADSKGNEIQKTAFRVKIIPDPVAAIKTAEGFKTNGLIAKKDLLDANGIAVFMNDFDFDLSFKVVSFVLSYTVPNAFTIVEEVSKSDKFTEIQIEGIKSLIKFQKLTIEEITIIGPDGMKRKLNPMVFTIISE